VAAVKQMRSQLDTVIAERSALDASSRLELVGELVKLGAELPATAWEGNPEDRKPCSRLVAEPVEAMRSRVAALRAARPDGHQGPKPPAPKRDAEGLTTEEKEMADKMNPAQRSRYVALRLARRAK
jgi:hypothetical protein